MSSASKLLIVDDEESFLTTTADLFRESGIECDCARNAQAASELIREYSYDLMVCDIKMPGNSGLEFIREIPQISSWLPVILVTGYPSIDTAIDSISLPVAGYMVKPVVFDELLSQARGLMDKSRIYRAVRETQKSISGVEAELNRIEEIIKVRRAEGSSVDIELFFMSTICTMTRGLVDLQHVADAIVSRDQGKHVCRLLNCPRLAVLSHAVNDTIEVLEQTKNAFKSKALGELRHKLEDVLKEVTI